MKKLITFAVVIIAACVLLVYILPDKPKNGEAVSTGSQVSKDTLSSNDNKNSSITDDGAEAYINGIFAGEKTTVENRNKILARIQDVNWIKLDKLNQGRAFELMEWLGKQALSDSELVSVMCATNGLDGAYTESYCALLGGLCRRDRHAFIYAAGKLDSKQLEVVCGFTAYDLGYSSNKNFTEELKKYLKYTKLNSDEKRAAQELLKAIEAGIQ